jgi:hypothetical protein
MTYDSLLTDVEAYADQHDASFLAQIPRLIMLCENRIASEVRGLGYTRFANFNMAAGTAYYQKPARWRETIDLSVTLATGRRKFLFERGYEYLRFFWPDTSQTGEPRYYGNYGFEHFLVVPTPAAITACELAYYERPEPLSDVHQTNWTTQYAPQLLLYGTLLEAQPFLKRPDRTKEFQDMYDRAVAAVTGEAQKRLGDQANARTDG